MKHLCSALLVLWVCAATYGQPPTIAKLRTQLANARHDTTRIRLYGELTSLYNKQKKPDSAYYLAKAGIALARQYQLPVAESQLYYHLGNYYKRVVQIANAQKAFETAYQLGKTTAPSALQCRILYRMACVYGDLGAYQKGIETCVSMLRMAQAIKDTSQIINAYNHLAMANLDQHNEQLALSYAQKNYQQAQQFAISHPDQADRVLMAQVTFADVYEATGQYARAYPHRRRAFDYYDTHADPLYLSESARQVGNNLVNQHKPREAIRFLDEALRRNLIPEHTSTNVYEVYAKAYEQLNQSHLALTYARKAYDQTLSVGNPKHIQSSLTTLINLQEKQRLYPQALANLRQFMVINDSLFTAEKAKAIADVEARYQLNQKEQAIQLLQNEATLKQLSLTKNQNELAIQRQQKILLSLFAVLLLLGLAGLYITFRRERITRQLLTARKEEIETKAAQLQQLNTLKDNLFSIIGHDLRSPLAALKVKLTDLANRQVTLTPDEPSYLRMSRLVDNVYATTDNLLNWSLLQRGGIKVWNAEFDLAEIARSVEQLLSSQHRQKQLRLTISLQPAPVLADERQLEIVVRNLLHNAIKFTPEGGHIRLSTSQQDGRSVLLIQDSGMGMTDADHATPAYLHSRSHSADSGTGLGLTICREFVKLNHGQLHIQSTIGQGTTVTIRFESARSVG